MAAPVDPHPDFVPGQPARANEVDDRFAALYNALNPAAGGVDLPALKAVVDALPAVADTNPVWRTVAQLDYRGGISGLSTTPCFVGGTALIASGASANAISGLWVPPTSADIAVTGKTTRLRVRACFAPNATAPGITVTWGLYPITLLTGASSGSIIPTLGTVITGSTAAAVTPPASQTNEAKSGSFDLSLVPPPSGYVIGVVGSGAQAANSLLGCTAYLEMRHA